MYFYEHVYIFILSLSFHDVHILDMAKERNVIRTRAFVLIQLFVLCQCFNITCLNQILSIPLLQE